MAHTILISDKFDAEGVRRLEGESDINVVYKGGHSREELLEHIGQANGLIIRSATKVDAEVLARAENLKLVVRAGVGVDNIDIPEASRRGVIVMNAPGGNTISTAEQAIGLMMALARHIPQANASMKSAKWEKNKFKGIELTGKTLGVIGLGRIGKEVVRKARGFGMEVLGYDPFIPEANLAHLEIEILKKEDLIKRADIITVHTPLTDATRDLINMDNLSDLKEGAFLINCARGGIYNEAALAEGLKSGRLGGVALDVLTVEPPPADFPLLQYDNCILTPHLGASTSDAEAAVATETIDEILEYFRSGVARNALNFPTMDPDTLDFLKPFFSGGENIGKLLGHLAGGDFQEVEINYYGRIATYMIQPVTTAILRGGLSLAMGEDDVNFVNAPFLAKDRGIRVIENKDEKVNRPLSSSVEVVFTSSSGEKVRLTYAAINREPMVISMYGLPIEFKPEGILVVIQNKDVPRVVGTAGMYLGDLGINIASLELCRDEKGGTAHCIIAVDELLDAQGMGNMRQLENIISAIQVDLRKPEER